MTTNLHTGMYFSHKDQIIISKDLTIHKTNYIFMIPSGE